MRNCKTCKKWPICEIHKNIDKETSLGLKKHVLSAHKSKHLSESWRSVFGGLARPCTLYEYMFNDSYEKFLNNKKLIKYIDEVVVKLKKDSELIEILLSDSFPEYKIEEISESLSLEIEGSEEYARLFESEEDLDDSWESAQYYVLSKFGF